MTNLIFFGLYLVALILLVWQSRRRSIQKTTHDFYLAGGTLGLLVLFCTLFSTQYSGNTFMAFPGKAYRMGYPYIMTVTFMMAMIAGYLLYAPRLRRLAIQKGFVTPGDWIHFRYRSYPLTLLCALLMIFAMMNYLLAQLMAMGHALSGLTQGQIPYEAGVLFLAFLIVLYETLGGMRAVAWTDVIQGLLMIVSVGVLGCFFISQGSHLGNLPQRILELKPEAVRVPDASTCRLWASTIFIVGLGGAMYPQGIQRLYAAKSTPILKRALCFMVFMPLVTVFFAYLVGIMAIEQFPGLSGLKSDEVMTRMLGFLADQNIILHFAVSLLLVGALAAMMSTADSVLLSLSSIIVLDIYAKGSRKPPPDEKLLKAGKRISWVIMILLVLVALRPEVTLWRLLEIKFELLVQIAPLFILGFYKPQLNAKIVFLALLAGLSVSLGGTLWGPGKWYGIHFGTLGCLVNFLICFAYGKLNNISPGRIIASCKSS
jgi:solute:Na+ symporter, SSS family